MCVFPVDRLGVGGRLARLLQRAGQNLDLGAGAGRRALLAGGKGDAGARVKHGKLAVGAELERGGFGGLVPDGVHHLRELGLREAQLDVGVALGE